MHVIGSIFGGSPSNDYSSFLIEVDVYSKKMMIYIIPQHHGYKEFYLDMVQNQIMKPQVFSISLE